MVITILSILKKVLGCIMGELDVSQRILSSYGVFDH